MSINIETGMKVRDLSQENTGFVVWMTCDKCWATVEWQGADKNEPVVYTTVHVSQLDCREDWQF
jgi:hypothetical protein